jgi:hypothetical protein
VSATSWSEYFSLSIFPNKHDSTRTPYGIRDRMIVVTGCLRGDLGTYCLYFFDGGWLEVPAASVCTSKCHYGQPVTSSNVPFSGMSETFV